jgi:hypothetical protein
MVEIHLDKPWGALLARFSGPSGTADTGSWETDGMRFFLQDTSNGHPLTAQYTLATVIASYPDYPAPFCTPPYFLGCAIQPAGPLPTGVLFGATPGVIPDPGNTGLGTATLFWNAPGYSNLEVHVNAPDGTLFAASSGDIGSATTGQWVRDGMRFFLQDPSSGTTIGIVTVGLQPATQHFVAFYTAESGLLVFDRDSGDRLGWFCCSQFPSGVTPIDLHTSPDGTLIYMMGSDFNYYVLDPATDAVVATFSVGSQPTAPPGAAAFTFMKGPANQDLLIAAPDVNGNISIVDPALKTMTSGVNCQCSGQLSPYYNQFNGTTYFFNPVIGGGSQIFGVTQNLILTTPITWGPATPAVPMNGTTLWNLLAVDSGTQGAFVTPNFTTTAQSAGCFGGCLSPPFGIPISDGAGIYDIQSAATSAASLTPESVSPDGLSIYGRVFATETLGGGPSGYAPSVVPPDGFCYIIGVGGDGSGSGASPVYTCYRSSSVVRYQLTSVNGAATFAPVATLSMPGVRPPSAFDDQYAYLIWLNADSVLFNGFIDQGNPISLGSIHKADPLTLQPIPGDNPIPFATPGGPSPALTGDLVGNILVGAYTYTGTGPSGAGNN